MTSDDPKTGSTVQPLAQIGSYRLMETLGSGGMSSVFRAIHEETGLEVAVKILPRSLAKNATMLQRFLREAKSAEALEHPNVVAIYDRGTENGRYYLVLEYVAGGDLHEYVRRRGALPADEAIRIIKGVTRGLAYAADLGVIHRDIKPANILLTPEGEPKVADLGLAVQQDEEDERVTRDGTTVGTVDYMSPEQARDSRATSTRSDIYSLGCTFFQILTGTPPFAGGDVTDKLRRHAFEPPPDLRVRRPDLSPALAALIARMLAKKPEQRFADYAEFIAALDALPSAGAGGLAPHGPLDAIVVDDEASSLPLDAIVVDDDDEDEADGPLDALVVDDDDEDFLQSGDIKLGSTSEASTIPERAPTSRNGTGGDRRPAATTTEFRSSAKAPAEPSRPEINLADLARIEDDDGPPVRKPSRSRPNSIAPAGPSLLTAALDDEVPYKLAGSIPAGRRYSAEDDSVQTWIIRGLMIGVAIVLLGFGIIQLLTIEFFPPAASESSEAGASESSSTLLHVEHPVVGGPRNAFSKYV